MTRRNIRKFVPFLEMKIGITPVAVLDSFQTGEFLRYISGNFFIIVYKFLKNYGCQTTSIKRDEKYAGKR
jgi:hypothetical protein